MAYFYIKDAAILFVAWIVFIQIREWARWRSLKRFGDANGCGDLPVVSNKLPGGLDRAIKVFTTSKTNSNRLSQLRVYFLFLETEIKTQCRIPD